MNSSWILFILLDMSNLITDISVVSSSRCYDVLSLHQDRTDDICSRGRLDPVDESVFCHATLEADATVHGRFRHAWYILQLRTKSTYGEVHREGEIVWALCDKHLRDHRRRIHRGGSDRLAALSFSARDTEEDRVRKVQLKFGTQLRHRLPSILIGSVCRRRLLSAEVLSVFLRRREQIAEKY